MTILMIETDYNADADDDKFDDDNDDKDYSMFKADI